MSSDTTVSPDWLAGNRGVLLAYSVGVVAIGMFASAYFVWEGKYFLAVLPTCIILALLVVTHPKLVLGQFVLILFIQYAVIKSVPLYVTDISAFLVIMAAVLDCLIDDQLSLKLPRLSLNFVWLLMVVFVTASITQLKYPDASTRL